MSKKRISRELTPIIESANYIVDLGARNGKEIDWFLAVSSKVRVSAFECYPSYVDYLKEKYKNEDRCQVFNMAVSNVDGEQPLYMDIKSKDSSSLKKPSDLMKKYRTFADEPIIVKTCKLDTWYPGSGVGVIDLLWSDIQGQEIEMINGASQVLKNTRYLFTEYNQADFYEGISKLDQIIDLLLPNFDVQAIFPGGKGGGDILFRNKSCDILR